jgi:hypothetical protein
MFRAYLKGILRLIPTFYAAKKSTKVVSLKSFSEPTYEEFRFDLDEMRCPICGRRPHKGLTVQLSNKARSRGMMACEMHGPVKAEIIISLRTGSEDPQAA